MSKSVSACGVSSSDCVRWNEEEEKSTGEVARGHKLLCVGRRVLLVPRYTDTWRERERALSVESPWLLYVEAVGECRIFSLNTLFVSLSVLSKSSDFECVEYMCYVYLSLSLSVCISSVAAGPVRSISVDVSSSWRVSEWRAAMGREEEEEVCR